MCLPEFFDPTTRTFRFDVRVTKQFLINFLLLSFTSPPFEGRLDPDSLPDELLLLQSQPGATVSHSSFF